MWVLLPAKVLPLREYLRGREGREKETRIPPPTDPPCCDYQGIFLKDKTFITENVLRNTEKNYLVLKVKLQESPRLPLTEDEELSLTRNSTNKFNKKKFPVKNNGRVITGIIPPSPRNPLAT